VGERKTGKGRMDEKEISTGVVFNCAFPEIYMAYLQELITQYLIYIPHHKNRLKRLKLKKVTSVKISVGLIRFWFNFEYAFYSPAELYGPLGGGGRQKVK
jgi:hypothetical protein